MFLGKNAKPTIVGVRLVDWWEVASCGINHIYPLEAVVYSSSGAVYHITAL